MCLKKVIADIYNTYVNSVLSLSSYVDVMGSAIQKIQGANEDLLIKFVAAKAGAADASTQSHREGFISVSLEESEMDLLVETMRFSKERAEMYPNLMLRMSYIYLMSLFDAFVSDVLESVIKSRPEMLRSKKQITYEKALEFSSIDEMVEYLARRELNELGYKSIKEQSDYYRERFGIVLSDSGVSIEMLAELRCRRNILVHNNGVVNHIYLEQVPYSNYSQGEMLPVELGYFKAAEKSLCAVARFLVLEIIRKHAKE